MKRGSWIALLSLAMILGVVHPLIWGVWLPDVFGKQHILCSETTRSGHWIRIVQYWNHVDFYTTEARVTGPDGLTEITLIDGDASKSWGARLEMDPSQTRATYTIPGGRTDTITW